jgi:hypothetical protein
MMQGFINNAAWLRATARGIGYALLAVALLDMIVIFFPPRFLDAAWELQLVGQLVERMPIPLLGIAFVLYGEGTGGKRRLLDIAPFILLIIAILYLLLVPLGLRSAWDINTENNRQLTTQYELQTRQVKERKRQLKEASAQNMDDAFAILAKQGKLGDIKSAQELKTRIFSEIIKAETELKNSSAATRDQVRSNLVSKAAKWNLSALVSAVIYAFMWRMLVLRNKTAEEENWDALQN